MSTRDRTESSHKYYINLTEEQKELRRMRRIRHYYQKKGVIPYDTTVLGRWCKEHNLDVSKVVSGEIPI